MTEDFEDFIDGAEGADIFDPADLDRAMSEFEKDKVELTDEVTKALERRRLAYVAVFTPGHREQSDIDIVLNDLAWFCRAGAPTFDKNDGVHAETLMKIKEGRREVHSRIIDFARLSYAAIILKYTDAITK